MNPLPKYRIDLVEEVEKTLFEDEKISLIFLLFGDDKAALKIAKECKSPLIDWVLQQSGGIEDKKCITTFLEALAIVGNFELLSKLFGINKKEAHDRFLPNSKHSSLYVPLLRKCLYLLCEAMNENDCINFLTPMQHSPPALDKEKYNPLNLEIYFLHWLADGVISATNIEPILNALKQIGKNELCDYLDPFQSKKIQNTPYNDPNRYYNMDPENAGICCIINQKNFSSTTLPLEDRIGTDVDKEKIIETFVMFGYRIHIIENVTTDELRKQLFAFSRNEVKPTDCSLVICILSHGLKDEIYCTNGSTEKIQNMKKIFSANNCTALLGKPKLFFIQACQGSVFQEVVSRFVLEDTIATDAPSHQATAPSLDSAGQYEDFFAFFSTVPDFVSFRHQITGSFFISAVTSELVMKSQEMAFQNILSSITNRCSQQTITMNNSLVTATPENRGTLRKDIKWKYTKEGLIEGTQQRMKRELFNQVAREFLLQFCRNKLKTA